MKSNNNIPATDGELSPIPAELCNKFVSWWDGEYEGTCELPKGHAGPHYDGSSCFDDELSEVELKSLSLPPVVVSAGYYKSGKLCQVQKQVLSSYNYTMVMQPEPGIEIRMEISR